MFFTVTQIVKNLLAMQETQVQFLAWEDPLEEEMETHASIRAWKILWTEEPGGLQSRELQRVKYNWAAAKGVMHTDHLETINKAGLPAPSATLGVSTVEISFGAQCQEDILGSCASLRR